MNKKWIVIIAIIGIILVGALWAIKRMSDMLFISAIDTAIPAS